jgi:DNA mismatch endonuclease (patch repair protein)
MSRVRGSGGRAEIALRSALHRRGLRFRKNASSLFGKPDIVFSRARVVVFVDGDFWHARVLVERGEGAFAASLKTANRRFWLDKLARNAARDREVTARLNTESWHVERFWETDVKRNIDAVAARIEEVVRARSP